MPNETSQPFQDGKQRKPDDRELVAGVLGPKEAAEMAELLGQAESQEAESASQAAGLDLSDKEQAATTEAEKTKAELRRDEYIAWAEKIDKDEEWVAETFVFNADGTVIAEGNVDLSFCRIDTLPPNLIEVAGDLDLRSSQITSLIGLPETVGGGLNLRDNQITSLEGLPKTIDGSLNLGNNQITSLKGLPKTISKDLYLHDNQITSLEGLPNTVGWNLFLNNNQITSLKGLPKTVGICLNLSYNQITSLEGLPNTIGNRLDLSNNPTTSIPEGLDIGVIFLSSSQTELKTDCEAKGYKVTVI